MKPPLYTLRIVGVHKNPADYAICNDSEKEGAEFKKFQLQKDLLKSYCHWLRLLSLQNNKQEYNHEDTALNIVSVHKTAR